VVDYNDGRVVTSMVSSGLSLNMVFDDRDSPIHATRGYSAPGSFRVSPNWLGSEKAYAVGMEGAKGLFLGTGEAF
jgi:hypothetical protein